jgi:hypothetical protein
MIEELEILIDITIFSFIPSITKTSLIEINENALKNGDSLIIDGREIVSGQVLRYE